MDLKAFCYLSSLLITMFAFARLGQRDLSEHLRHGKFVFNLSCFGIICFVCSIFLLPERANALYFFYSRSPFDILSTTLCCVLACVAASRDDNQKTLRIVLGIGSIIFWIIPGLITAAVDVWFACESFSATSIGFLIGKALSGLTSIVALLCFSLIVFQKKMHRGISLGLFLLSALITAIRLIIICLPILTGGAGISVETVIFTITNFGCVICLLLISCSKINNSSGAVLVIIFVGVAAISLHWTINCFAPGKSDLYPLIKKEGHKILITQLESKKDGDIIWLDDNTVGTINYSAGYVKDLVSRKNFRKQSGSSYDLLQHIYKEVEVIIRQNTGKLIFFQQPKVCTVQWGRPNDAIIKSIRMHRKNKFGQKKYFEAKVFYSIPFGVIKNSKKYNLMLINRNEANIRDRAKSLFTSDFFKDELINESVGKAVRQSDAMLDNARLEGVAVFQYYGDEWRVPENNYSYISLPYESERFLKRTDFDNVFGLRNDLNNIDSPVYFLKSEQNEIDIIVNGEIQYNGQIYNIDQLRKKLFSEYTERFVRQINDYSESELFRLRSAILNADIVEINKERCIGLIDKYITEARESRARANESRSRKLAEINAMLAKLSAGKNISEWEIENFASGNEVLGTEYEKIKEQFCILAMLRVNRNQGIYLWKKSSVRDRIYRQNVCRECRGRGVLPCRTCRGSGVCARCHGSGSRSVARFGSNGFVRDYESCERYCNLCRGKRTRLCSGCNGDQVGVPAKNTVISLATELKRKLEQYMSQ